ncbi:hypothetical protein [Nesterenkonia sandarakina]|uniref:hypothetical protein n=1 Tax=Nesterenkonia sandarakina TaxID=272918 RepID=UPI0011B25C06|nr:hypothetical protein [Nesterenkonia sandarakina]
MSEGNPFSTKTGAARSMPKVAPQPKAAQSMPPQKPKPTAAQKSRAGATRVQHAAAPKPQTPVLNAVAVEEAKQERANPAPLTENEVGDLGKVGKDGVFYPKGWNKKKKSVRKFYGEQDFLVLALCALAGVITKRMAFQLLGVKETTAYNRLGALVRSGMLEAVQVPPTQVYVLKRKALSLLNSYGFEEEHATLMTAEQVFGGRETKHILARGQWLASTIAAMPEEDRLPYLTGESGESGFFISETAIKADALTVWGKEDGAIQRVGAVRSAQSSWRASGHSEDYLLENLRAFQYCQSIDRLGRPDGVVFDGEGRHAAIEIETSRKSTPEYDRILGFFAQENNGSPFAGVIYVVTEEKVERAIKRSKFYEELAAQNIVQIQRLKNAYGEEVRSTRDVWKL